MTTAHVDTESLISLLLKSNSNLKIGIISGSFRKAKEVFQNVAYEFLQIQDAKDHENTNEWRINYNANIFVALPANLKQIRQYGLDILIIDNHDLISGKDMQDLSTAAKVKILA